MHKAHLCGISHTLPSVATPPSTVQPSANKLQHYRICFQRSSSMAVFRSFIHVLAFLANPLVSTSGILRHFVVLIQKERKKHLFCVVEKCWDAKIVFFVVLVRQERKNRLFCSWKKEKKKKQSKEIKKKKSGQKEQEEEKSKVGKKKEKEKSNKVKLHTFRPFV